MPFEIVGGASAKFCIPECPHLADLKADLRFHDLATAWAVDMLDDLLNGRASLEAVRENLQNALTAIRGLRARVEELGRGASCVCPKRNLNGGALLDALEALFVRVIFRNRSLLDSAREAGVSPGFLAEVAAANADDFLREMVEAAAEAGELVCRECYGSDYHNYAEAPRNDKGEPACPECGGLLRSAYCWHCGAEIEKPREADVVDGRTCCPKCASRAFWGSGSEEAAL